MCGRTSTRYQACFRHGGGRAEGRDEDVQHTGRPEAICTGGDGSGGAGEATKAFKRRLSKLKQKMPGEEKEAEKRGYLNVDFLGSRCFFAGFTFAYGEETSEWLVLDTAREMK